jgi:SAM-dependent methyltransferase
MTAPTTRFSDRVADYVRTRPSYPAALLDAIAARLALKPGAVVVDLGSGTGISTKLLLDRGFVVHAVEPNEPMRAAAVAPLGGRPGFHPVAATAEATTLAESSLDAAFAFQAFHWFDPEKTRTELRRVLRPGAGVALVWNDRLVDTPFLRAYEELLLAASPDYATVVHRNAYPVVNAFFAPHAPSEITVKNEQIFDREGLLGRAFSSSYVPKSGPAHDHFRTELERLFDRHATVDPGAPGGPRTVSFRYDSKAFVGVLDGG